jgi:hypothetical protein
MHRSALIVVAILSAALLGTMSSDASARAAGRAIPLVKTTELSARAHIANCFPAKLPHKGAVARKSACN